MGKGKFFPVPPYRVQKLLGRYQDNRVWGTVKTARPAVAERVFLRMRSDKRNAVLSQVVRLIER